MMKFRVYCFVMPPKLYFELDFQVTAYNTLAAVSDAGSGGQILMDEPTFLQAATLVLTILTHVLTYLLQLCLMRALVARSSWTSPPSCKSGSPNLMHSNFLIYNTYYVLSHAAVSDAGSGGQILMDEPTFLQIKQQLHFDHSSVCMGFTIRTAVSDAGSGGQILMDEPTFLQIKERLFELGAVDANGMNYKRLKRLRLSHNIRSGFGLLCWAPKPKDMMAQAAVVFDM